MKISIRFVFPLMRREHNESKSYGCNYTLEMIFSSTVIENLDRVEEWAKILKENIFDVLKETERFPETSDSPSYTLEATFFVGYDIDVFLKIYTFLIEKFPVGLRGVKLKELSGKKEFSYVNDWLL